MTEELPNPPPHLAFYHTVEYAPGRWTPGWPVVVPIVDLIIGAMRRLDFRGKRVATPQLGNTQDVAARAWLKEGGLKVLVTGGDVNILPTRNPDQLSLFSRAPPRLRRASPKSSGHGAVTTPD